MSVSKTFPGVCEMCGTSHATYLYSGYGVLCSSCRGVCQVGSLDGVRGGLALYAATRPGLPLHAYLPVLVEVAAEFGVTAFKDAGVDAPESPFGWIGEEALGAARAELVVRVRARTAASVAARARAAEAARREAAEKIAASR